MAPLSLALLVAGCEKAPAPGNLLSPPSRVQQGTPAPPPRAAPPPAPLPAAEAPPPRAERLSLPEPFSRLTVVDPLRMGSLEDLTVLTTVPHLTPPRAILRTGNGQERVVTLGDRLGEDGAIVSSVTPTAITVTQLRMDPATGSVDLSDVRLMAMVPSPAAATVAPPPPADAAPEDVSPAP